MTMLIRRSCRLGRTRKITMRGHGVMVGGTANDMPPPP